MALTTAVFAKCLEIQIKSLNDQLQLLRETEGGEDGGGAGEGNAKKKKKKNKAVVDPNKPKRSHTAYQLFMMDILPKLKAAHPTKIQKELMSMAASQWTHLDEESKKSFVDIAARDKEEFQKKLSVYNETSDSPSGDAIPDEGTKRSSSSTETTTAAATATKTKTKTAVAAPAAPVAAAVAAPTATTTTTPEPENPSSENHHKKKKKKDKKRKSDAGEPTPDSKKRSKSD